MQNRNVLSHQCYNASFQQEAQFISLSERQIRRIVQRIRGEGDAGILHKARGRQSPRKLPRRLKDRVLSLYRTVYAGFGPTLFTEKLEEREGIAVSRETVRTWLMEEDLWKKHRKRHAHRQWRERKDHCGAMLQMDGSHHDWFEGRGPECVFMGYIDDAREPSPRWTVSGAMSNSTTSP